MFRILRVFDDSLPANRERIAQVEEMLRMRFPDAPEGEFSGLGEKLRNPFKHRFRAILFVAETLHRKVRGFAVLLHEPKLKFCYLDWIAAGKKQTGGGLGGALYDRVRAEAAALECKGLFFECLPDDPKACPDNPDLMSENRARLRFYEQYGARPIMNTGYESPVRPGDTCMPHLVYDGLDPSRPLRRAFARRVVRAVLERKYADYCPATYVDAVTASFRDDPVKLRPFKYIRPEAAHPELEIGSPEPIALVVNDRHQIHHVHERGYVESPVRIRSIQAELDKSGLFVRIPVRGFPKKHITAVHDPKFVNYLERACRDVAENKSLYPYVFPIRNKTRPPREPAVLAGYYCIDTFTPIHRNAFPAARRAVDCALTAAGEILEGRRLAYALVRPPGHHAERRSFGGFCYFNTGAIAAQFLRAHGPVAILDIDYHHGNGQQEIFYRRADVLTVSIHGHPVFAYPYFSGFREETGEEEGEGFNMNLPLPEKVDGKRYAAALSHALERVAEFKPRFLMISLGLDTAKGDPTGTWSLTPKDFEENGGKIGALGLPTLVVQEGGYRNRSLGRYARSFFTGLARASLRSPEKARKPVHRKPAVALQADAEFPVRDEVVSGDAERVRALAAATGFFTPAEIELAQELVLEATDKGDAAGYRFLFHETGERLAGYACFGPVPCTVSSYDIYWIAVHPDFQRGGIGRLLLKEAERRIKAGGGTRIYVDTSGRSQYSGTRAFYERAGYAKACSLPDFYAPGDGKTVFFKALG